MDSLVVGLSLGTAAGISPGPLLVFVVTAAIRGGWASGVLAACAPLVSDSLIMVLTVFVLGALPATTLAWVALLGAVFVLWSGLRTIVVARTATIMPADASGLGVKRQAFAQAGLVNLLSPHPWIFWATVMGPLTVDTWDEDHGSAVALLVGFYVTIVGAKALIGALVGKSRHRLSDRGYRRALVVAGALLMVAAVGILAEFGPSALGSVL